MPVTEWSWTSKRKLRRSSNNSRKQAESQTGDGRPSPVLFCLRRFLYGRPMVADKLMTK
jgi:hypothetical protein